MCSPQYLQGTQPAVGKRQQHAGCRHMLLSILASEAGQGAALPCSCRWPPVHRPPASRHLQNCTAPCVVALQLQCVGIQQQAAPLDKRCTIACIGGTGRSTNWKSESN